MLCLEVTNGKIEKEMKVRVHVTFDQHLPLNCCNEITMFDDSIYLNYDLL